MEGALAERGHDRLGMLQPVVSGVPKVETFLSIDILSLPMATELLA